MLQEKLYTRHETTVSIICYIAPCAVPLLSFPLNPLLQQCWPAACSSSPLSAASADAVAGAWSPGFAETTAAGRVKEKRWRNETRHAAVWKVHLTWRLHYNPCLWFCFIHTCLAVSRQLGVKLKGDTDEAGVHFMISVSTMSSAPTWADISFSCLGIK